MGIYIYTMLRNKPVRTDFGPVYLQKYLCKAADLDDLFTEGRGLLQARIDQARETWIVDEDIYFVLPTGGDCDVAQAGDKVFRGTANDACVWCDYDGVPGTLLGVLVEQDGCWMVKPHCRFCRGEGQEADDSKDGGWALCRECEGTGVRQEAV